MGTIQFNFDSTYLSLPDKMYVRQSPVPVKRPTLVIFNSPLAQNLGLDVSVCSDQHLADIFSGNVLPSGAVPFAQAYAGHQFGHFTMLGDGRAIMFGEHITPAGLRVDVQLKGSGITPFSRRGDGRAALGPMLREYIMSEAMHALGIPTTRSLAVVSTGDAVLRESVLPGAILTRVAASHLRVGTFEYAARQEDHSILKALVSYTVKRHYPECVQSENIALELLRSVVLKQVDLIVHWMRVGFIHGVMNTDNMSLAGETIDYGPCAFMDAYNPKTVFSYIDEHGRYAFGNQPKIAEWNLARFAETLLPLIAESAELAVQMASDVLEKFQECYAEKWLSMMRCKLGMLTSDEDDASIVQDLLTWMERNNMDYTNTFRALSSGDVPKGEVFSQQNFLNWHARWLRRLEKNNGLFHDALDLMKRTNPAYIPRNHLVNAALRSAEHDGDMGSLHMLLQVLGTPYVEQMGCEKFQLPPLIHERVQHTFCGT